MQDIQEPPVQYESYLLRLRRTIQDGRPVCRVALIELSSQETRYFADMGELTRYLTQSRDTTFPTGASTP